MAMITVAIPTSSGETIGVLAERITPHLAIHPALVIGCAGATDYDESALELTYTLNGAMVCQISDPLTVRPGAIRGFAQWLETVCPFSELGHDLVPKGLPKAVRAQIRRFVDAPNDWQLPSCSESHTTMPAVP
ncbi:hypothetical protein [Mycobacterium sp. SP-6446]|uniref:hypothetical protein n=1 Tax=Mycobacterium sp. SP-6446 TaxID=1834162 RepID=UPI000979D268|nr:hypothetical protein [Mycobacterium sp. SP-6446]OMC10581.1 hypothetical protein A5736_00165 [Mycobacterium sp. SP-6446]